MSLKSTKLLSSSTNSLNLICSNSTRDDDDNDANSTHLNDDDDNNNNNKTKNENFLNVPILSRHYHRCISEPEWTLDDNYLDSVNTNTAITRTCDVVDEDHSDLNELDGVFFDNLLLTDNSSSCSYFSNRNSRSNNNDNEKVIN